MFGASIKQMSYGYELDARTVSDPVFSSGDSNAVMAYDAGVLYRSGKDGKFRASFAVKDLNEPDIGFQSTVLQERAYRMGVSYLFDEISVLPFSLRPAVDGELRGTHHSVYMGFEAVTLSKEFTFRAGGSFLDGKGRNPSMGASYTLSKGGAWSMSLDYAFIFPVHMEETIGDHSAGIRFSCR
jgi:hypothetical protein